MGCRHCVCSGAAAAAGRVRGSVSCVRVEVSCVRVEVSCVRVEVSCVRVCSAAPRVSRLGVAARQLLRLTSEAAEIHPKCSAIGHRTRALVSGPQACAAQTRVKRAERIAEGLPARRSGKKAEAHQAVRRLLHVCVCI